MSRWFRMHDSTLDDPKVQKLPDALFKAWVNLLCLTCRNDGVLPPLEGIAFSLRKSEKDAEKILETLIARQLLDVTETGTSPHNWNGRQYKSDVSTERVKRFRQRSGTVSETPSETEQIQIQSRAEQTDGADAPAAQEANSERPFKLPGNWQPSQHGRDHAADKGLDPSSALEAFVDYFTEGRGKREKRTAAGWERRFCIWCTRDADTKRPAGRVRPAATGGDAGAFARAAARMGGADGDGF